MLLPRDDTYDLLSPDPEDLKRASFSYFLPKSPSKPLFTQSTPYLKVASDPKVATLSIIADSNEVETLVIKP